ncbi:TolC family protein [Bacteroidales bacterium OttesenSCG-928-A17]|nr:TolC family protein [Bacteroidales bacterium OttesenSCG-928-A17]
MKKKIIILYLISCTVSLSAQQNILQEIEQNNTVLSALRHQTEADKTENKTGLYPENPEVEFAYLWGNSDETRTDWSVSQGFDFPTTYYHKKKFSDLQNRQLDLQYQVERKDILLEASMLCIQLIYWNALSDKLEEQLNLTQQVADAYRKKYEAGDASLLDMNKAQYDLTDALKEYRNAVTEKEFIQSELTRLNGGISFQLTAKTFPQFVLPLHFESWYEERKEKNQLLKFYRQSVHLSSENEKLQRSLNLPKIKAGYMSEKVMNEHFQGVTVGVSVPLWENKNTVKQIKAQTLANREMEKNETLKDYHQTRALYKKAQNLQLTVSDIKKQQEEDNTVYLLKKSLNLGEISLIEFILELGIYYDMQQSMLEMERDLHLTASELMQWEN